MLNNNILFIMILCITCGKEFTPTSKHIRKYCSKKCKARANSKKHSKRKNKGINKKTGLPSAKIIGKSEYAKLWSQLEQGRKYAQRAYQKEIERYHNDPIYHKQRNEQTRKVGYNIRQKLRQELFIKFGNKCKICGETSQVCFTFHHINEELKPMRGDSAIKWQTIDKLKNHFTQLDNIILLCENCHRKLHAGLIKLEINNPCVP